MLDSFSGSTIFGSTAFHGIQTGGQFPCLLDSTSSGISATNSAFGCHIEVGSITNFGQVTRIFVTEIALTASQTGKISLLIVNPLVG